MSELNEPAPLIEERERVNVRHTMERFAFTPARLAAQFGMAIWAGMTFVIVGGVIAYFSEVWGWLVLAIVGAPLIGYGLSGRWTLNQRLAMWESEILVDRTEYAPPPAPPAAEGGRVVEYQNGTLTRSVPLVRAGKLVRFGDEEFMFSGEMLDKMLQSYRGGKRNLTRSVWGWSGPDYQVLRRVLLGRGAIDEQGIWTPVGVQWLNEED